METDTFTPSKFKFAYKKNLRAKSRETMNHAKESHLFNEPWNVQSKEFVIAVTLLGKCMTYVHYMGIKPNVCIPFDRRVEILKCFQLRSVWVHWVPPGLL